LCLLIWRHVEVSVFHATFTREVIADQICAIGPQQRYNISVQCRCTTLVPQLVNGLIGDDEIKHSQIIWPRLVQEAALKKLHPLGLAPEPLRRKAMHCRRKVQRNIPNNVGQLIKQMLRKKAGARAQLEHVKVTRLTLASHFRNECIKELGSPWTLLHGSGFPLQRVCHASQVDWAWYVDVHVLWAQPFALSGRRSRPLQQKVGRDFRLNKSHVLTAQGATALQSQVF